MTRPPLDPRHPEGGHHHEGPAQDAARLRPRVPALLFVTPEPESTADLESLIDDAARAGAAIQLRAKHSSARMVAALAHKARASTRRHGVVLLINDRVDIALDCGADGVHLPANAMSVHDARRLLGPQALLGRSVHSAAEVLELAPESCTVAPPCDYVQFGNVWETGSKPGLQARGLEALAACSLAARRAGMATLAVGGVDISRIEAALAHGADGVAVIGAIARSPDACEAARQLLAALQSQHRARKS